MSGDRLMLGLMAAYVVLALGEMLALAGGGADHGERMVDVMTEA